MNSEFRRDDYWQRNLAEKFLDVTYRTRGWQVVRYPGDHDMQRLHVDVTLSRDAVTHNIDEKIIRGRHDRQRATKISIETWSCSVPGRERPGWISPEVQSKATILLFCFADDDGIDLEAWKRVRSLDCVWVPFKPLRDWFASQNQERWEMQDNMQSNRSLSRKVPIREIMKAIQGCARFTIFAPKPQEQPHDERPPRSHDHQTIEIAP